MKTIQTLEDFADLVNSLTADRDNWETSQLMNRIGREIVHTVKQGISVSSDVYIAYFHLYSLLGTTARREKIRGAVIGVKSWLQKSN